jgi:quinol monooxygenase YgiN
MPVIVATINPIPEHREEVRKALVEAVEAVHSEDGCNLYALHENDDRFVMVESWASPEAMAVHGQGPNLAALGKALKGKLTGPLDIVVLEAIPAGDRAKGALPA